MKLPDFLLRAFSGPRPRVLTLAVVLVVTLCATWQRARAVELLPAEKDELVYLPAAYRYAEMLQAGHWREVAAYRENSEHPPMVKLLYATELLVSGAPEPEWKTLKARTPLLESTVSSFRVTRWLSAIAGILQVALLAGISGIGALLLAFDPYHATYTSLAYLEAVPGLFAILALRTFERARRATGPLGGPGPLHLGWLAASGALLGLSAAGKYPYGLVVGLTLLPFLVRQARTQAKTWASVILPCVVVFFLADPALWPAPLTGLWESLTFHWNYSHGNTAVKPVKLPWAYPVLYLMHPGPAKWYPGVLITRMNAWVLLPLAIIGARATARQRPVWVVSAGVGPVFLLLWPTKWPQYQLLILPAVCVCAGQGARTLASFVMRRVGLVPRSPSVDSALG